MEIKKEKAKESKVKNKGFEAGATRADAQGLHAEKRASHNGASIEVDIRAAGYYVVRMLGRRIFWSKDVRANGYFCKIDDTNQQKDT